MSDLAALVADSLDIWTSAAQRKSGAGRGGGKRISLYGIERLRALILDLAVSGKLVEQDAGDEPASKLLTKIAVERKALQQAGKISKPKNLLPINPDELMVHPTWAATRFGEVFSLEYGDNLPEPKRSNSGEYNVFGSNGIVGTHNSFTVDRPCLIVGRKGSAGAINMSRQPCWVTDVAYHCVPPTGIDLEFQYYLFRTLGLDELGKGIKPGLNRNEANALAIPVPPLVEQRRIVGRVDELMALCDALERESANAMAAHHALVEVLLAMLVNSSDATDLACQWERLESHFDSLFTTDASIEALKQTILDLAVRGKLVEQDTGDEAAAVLLKRIKASQSSFRPFSIPESWAWTTVGSIGTSRLGKMLDKAKNKGIKRRYLRNANVRWFDFDLTDILEMPFEEAELSEFQLISGDILICEGGEPGRTAVWDGREDGIFFQKAIHRLRFKQGVDSNYFAYFMRCSAQTGLLNEYFTGSGIQHFTGKSLNCMVVPIPPLAEQRRIVATVDALMALCEALKARLVDADQTRCHLADAIVEKAAA